MKNSIFYIFKKLIDFCIKLQGISMKNSQFLLIKKLINFSIKLQGIRMKKQLIYIEIGLYIF